MADEKPINERVSVLETRMDYHDIVLKESLDRITTVAADLTTQVTRTNTILERFEEKLDATAIKVAEWDTVAKTLIKLTITVSVIIGGCWSVFEFAIDHKELVQTVTETK